LFKCVVYTPHHIISKTMDKFLTYLNKLDWALAIASFGLAYYFDQPWLYAASAIGLFMAWYKPANRIKAKVDSKFVQKAAAPTDADKLAADEAFYEEFSSAEDAYRKETRFNFTPALPKLPYVFSSNKHNQIRWQHLDLTANQGRWLI